MKKKFSDINSNLIFQTFAIFIFFIAVSASYTHLFFIGNNSSNIEKQDSQTISSSCLWNESSFSGSPRISGNAINDKNIYSHIASAISSSSATFSFFIILTTLIGIYVLQNTLKIKPPSAIIGSLAYGFFFCTSAYDPGEPAEAIGIALIAYSIAGIILIFNNKKAFGITITLIATAIQAATCNYQPLYFTMLIAIAHMAYRLVVSVKSHEKAKFLTSTLITLTVFTAAILTNSVNIISENEYAQYATQPTPDYSTDSPYINDEGEILTAIIPSIKGGKSHTHLSTNSDTHKLLEPLFGRQNAEKIADKSPTYFGKRFFSNGPSYIGAIAIFLAALGCFSKNAKYKWWLIFITIFAALLSCGNIEYFAFKNIPLFYNFGNISNILIISALGISILASVGIEDFCMKNRENEADKKRNTIAISISAGLIAIILLIFIIFPSAAGTFNYDPGNRTEEEIASGLASYMPSEPEYAEAVSQFKSDYVEAIRHDRCVLIRRDSSFALVFLLLSAATIFFASKKKQNITATILTIALLVILDNILININLDRLNAENENTTSRESVADNTINGDSTTYRVLNIAYDAVQDDESTFNKHKSLGGVGYCTKRYATFCDSLVNKELALTRYNIFSWSQRDGMTQEEIQETFSQKYKTPLLDMLNVKYIILSDNANPITNEHTLGNVWLVDSIRWAASDDMELAQLKHIDSRHTAVVNEKYKSEFADIGFAPDSTDRISLTARDADILKYKSTSKGPRLAIFSEMYYPKGWRVKIDGEKASHFRANYALRAMIVPAGEHEIEFTFAPKSTRIGNMLSLIFNIISLVAIVIFLTLGWKFSRKTN